MTVNEMSDRLMELIYEARKEWDVYFNDCLLKGKPRSKTLNEFIAVHFIENGVSVPQWISVKDRLPDNEKRVLVSVDSDKSDTKIDTDRMIHRQWVRWGMSVTHWMPLPEPPQAEQKLKEMRGETNA